MEKEKTEYIRLKLNTDLAGCKKNQVITLKAKNGIPLDRYWRKRLLDSIHDQCVEILENKKTSFETSKKKFKKGE
jgi:hypothetical protein